MKTMIQKLMMKNLYPQMISGDGLLSDISDYSVPWNSANIGSTLDFGYYLQSGQKLVSPFMKDIITSSDNVLTDNERTQIAGMLVVLFNRKWTKLWGVYQAEYNPINNYDMRESETIEVDTSNSGTNTGTINTSDTGTVSDSGTHTGTVSTDDDTTITRTITDTGTKTTVTDKDITNTGTQSNSGSSDTEDGLYGFNSSVAVGSNTSENTNSNTRTDNLATTDDTTETETRNLSHGESEIKDGTVAETRNLSDSNTKTLNTVELETQNLAHSDSGSSDTTRELTRVGNIGVTTTQQMIQSEIELWQWNYFKQVFDDIDSICCLSIY